VLAHDTVTSDVVSGLYRLHRVLSFRAEHAINDQAA